MTDLREGQPEGENLWPTRHHPAPLRSHQQKWDFGAPKRSKRRGEPCALPLLKQRGAAIPGGARIWTGAWLRLTRLALTGGTILGGVLRGVSWRVVGEVRCGGQKGLRPSTPSQPHPGSSHCGAHVPQALASPLVLTPRAALLATAPHPRPKPSPPTTNPWAHLQEPGLAPDRGSTRAGAPLRPGLLPGCWGPASPPPAGAWPASYSATPSRRSSGLGGCSAPTMFRGAYSSSRHWSAAGSQDRDTVIPSRPWTHLQSHGLSPTVSPKPRPRHPAGPRPAQATPRHPAGPRPGHAPRAHSPRL